MDKATVFILSQDGTYLEEEALDLLLQVLGKQFEPVNAPKLNHIMMKAGYEKGKRVLNAHNNPAYLLGAIEEAEATPIVIAWYEEDDTPRPKFFVNEIEIKALQKGLEENPEIDAWETAINVNRALRAKV